MITETQKSLTFPIIIIDHAGDRIKTDGKTPLDPKTWMTNDYKEWIAQAAGLGARAFRIITEAGNMMYCIKPETKC